MLDSSTRSSTCGEPSSSATSVSTSPISAAGCVCGATVRSCGEPCSRASSSRLPPQRCLVTTSPAIAVTFAANGWSRMAPTCASSSLPRSEPAATIASASCAASAFAHAAGWYGAANVTARTSPSERANPTACGRKLVVRLDEADDVHGSSSRCSPCSMALITCPHVRFAQASGTRQTSMPQKSPNA